MTKNAWVWGLFCVAVAGCGDDEGPAGSDAGRDSSTTDSAVSDGGGTDTGAGGDSSMADAGGSDAATDGPAPIGDECSLFTACDPEDFVDMTSEAGVTIMFGVGGSVYSPKCVAVAEGTSVTFSGNFSSHPLMQSCGPIDAIPDDATGDFSIVMDTAGDYGYFCINHGGAMGSGMAGMIRVIAN